MLSIAGTDPTGGAGIQADLKSIAANGGYGMAVVTALVAQNTQGVRSVHIPPVSFLLDQLEAVSDDVEIDGVKVGMLATAEVVQAISRWLDRVTPPVVVLDPVMIATSGDRLLDHNAEEALRELASRAHLLTPNIPELGILAEDQAANSWQAVLDQAARVSARYGVLVLAKGGHLDGDSVPDTIVGELQLHEGWIPAAAMDQAQPSATTTAYLDHLRAVAARGDYRVLIAALLPCFWLYHDVGTRLHSLSHPEHPFRSWLDTYADEKFAESTAQAINIVGRAAASADDVTAIAMREAFRISSAHEYSFFAAPDLLGDPTDGP